MQDCERNADATRVTLATEDGVTLHGWWFGGEAPTNLAVLAGATAVPQRFYRRFAAWLAARGVATLTFDYRGIGESLAGRDIADVTAELVDWGSRDIPAAVDWAGDRLPALPVHLIGHSAGGQMLGLMRNHRRLSRVVTFAASSGHIPNLLPAMRLKARFVFQLLGPVTTGTMGYFPASKIGFGEDLPAGVLRQWARWCRAPGYAASDREGAIGEHWFDEVDRPVLAITASDDPIATAPNAHDLWRHYPRLQITHRRVSPAEFGLREIGHMGLFRQAHQVLWPLVLEGLRPGAE